jgi:hypothetical protein
MKGSNRAPSIKESTVNNTMTRKEELIEWISIATDFIALAAVELTLIAAADGAPRFSVDSEGVVSA